MSLTKIKPHSIFSRKGYDVYSNTQIPLKTALLGGVVSIPTIHGNIEIKIKPGIQNEDVKRISGYGIKTDSLTEGSHFVTIRIEMPR